MCEEKEYIKVNKNSICDILNKKLIIPAYQRKYVWTYENVDTLINDIENFYNKKNCQEDNSNNEEDNNKKANEYFLGALLLYKNTENKYEIIDGQQRVITLYLILQNLKEIEDNVKEEEYSIKEKLKDNLEIYKSIYENSKHNIITNYNYIKNKIENDKIENDKIKILKANIENIVFTVIETTNIDDAFTFFDTHNTSGVRLNTVDILKAYHLRAINNEDEEKNKKEKMIESIVRRWDSHNANNGMQYILENINFSIRTTKINKQVYHINNKDNNLYKKLILNNYKNKKQEKDLAYKELFINEIKYDDFKNYTLTNKNKYSTNTINIPFSIRQPIKDGYSFFEYSAKYKELYEFLFVEETKENALNTLKDIYKAIVSTQQREYLKLVFEHLCFYYYDKFQDDNIALFSIRLLEIIAYHRLKNSYIKEAIYKTIILNNGIINLFDLINISFTTDEVIDTLSTIIGLFKKETIKEKELNAPQNKFFKYIEKLKNDLLKESIIFEKVKVI